jgi:hypothetical protein
MYLTIYKALLAATAFQKRSQCVQPLENRQVYFYLIPFIALYYLFQLPYLLNSRHHILLFALPTLVHLHLSLSLPQLNKFHQTNCHNTTLVDKDIASDACHVVALSLLTILLPE